MISFSISDHNFDVGKFEKEWQELAEKICVSIHNDPEVQKIKKNLRENGFLTLEEKSSFINLSDKIKYELIYQSFGPEGSVGYKQFSDAWKEWFRLKGVESKSELAQKTNIGHIMFGSTPNPEIFLKSSEEELQSV